MQNHKTLKIAKAILKKKEQLEVFQTILQSYNNQNSIVQAQKQTDRLIEQNRVPRNKPTHLLACLLSHFSYVQLCTTPQTAAHQAPPSLGFSRQEHWSGLPFPSPKPTHYGQLIHDKGGKNIQQRKNSLSNKWCLKNWTAIYKTIIFPHTTYKNKPKTD